jgi:hypothetical protein
MTSATSRLVPTTLALALAAGAASAGTLLPKFNPDRFEEGQAIDHKYFPLEPGRRAVLRARGVEDGEVFHEKSVLTVLGRPGPRILGVRTTTQLDRAYEDGLLVEKTFDYFAQDKRGNVWYMGEDVTNFHYDDDGNLIGTDHESEWRAGRRGGRPGWIMPARQIVGQRYFQEHARRDEALDIGETLGIRDRLRVGGTLYRNVLRVLETNPFEPGSREIKYYAPGVGIIRDDEGLDRNLKNPDLIFRRVDDGRGHRAERADSPRDRAASAHARLDRVERAAGRRDQRRDGRRSGGKRR